jgi:hypothetical protein
MAAPLTSAQLVAMLEAAPPRIAAATAGLSPAELRAAPEPDAWSANEVLAHMRACADQWGGCMRAMIGQERPTLRAINPRTWIKSTDYLEQDFLSSLQAYSAQRTALLAVLGRLTPEGWSREAAITGAGAPLVRTVYIYAHWLAIHERPHLRQIEVVARTLRGESPPAVPNRSRANSRRTPGAG